jgi:hypothetical protein
MKSFGDPVCTGRTATRVRSVRHAGVLPGRPCKACVRSVWHAAPQAPVSFGPGRAPAHARERAWSRSPAQAQADQRPSPAPCRGRSSARDPCEPPGGPACLRQMTRRRRPRRAQGEGGAYL